ncbi:MAG: AI-2E family transporter, partial [Clostridiales bacterium]|nr:AI-2E family transporter [Clostridiales bacterium]
MKKIGEKYKLLLAAAALAVAVVYFKDIIALQGRVLRALSPIFIGILFALILNIVLNFFERKVFTFKKSKRKKLKRPFNLFVTYLSFIAVVGGILALAVPNIVKSLNALAERLPEYVGLLPEKLESLAESLNIPDDTVADIAESLQKSAGELSQRLIGYIPKLIELSKNIFRGLYNILMGIVLSGFILGCKEKLISQFKKILNAFANQKTSDKIFEIMTIANKKLSRFLAGQSFESLVVGVACFGLTA